MELLYDLTFVVAFGVAADQLAHYLAEGHVGPAVAGFCLAVFAAVWAWLSYSWFASAYDNDDWVFRCATLVQMVGVVVNALGMEQMFASLDAGGSPDVGVMVLGYVVMQASMVFPWGQVVRQDPGRAPAAKTSMWTIGFAQVGWLALACLGPRSRSSSWQAAPCSLWNWRAQFRRSGRVPLPGTRGTSPKGTACWCGSPPPRHGPARGLTTLARRAAATSRPVNGHPSLAP